LLQGLQTTPQQGSSNRVTAAAGKQQQQQWQTAVQKRKGDAKFLYSGGVVYLVVS